MGLGRIRNGVLSATLLAVASFSEHGVAATPQDIVRIAVDHADQDLDGRPDSEESPLPAAARANLYALDSQLAGSVMRPTLGGNFLRVIAPDGKVVPWGSVLPRGSALQGISRGRATLQISRNNVDVERRAFDVVGLGFRDGALRDLDLSKERASLERLPPEPAPRSVDAPYEDFDALRALLIVADDSPAATQPEVVDVESISASGAAIDRLEHVAAERTLPCPDHAVCYATEPLRFVVDDVDRTHILVGDRSVRAEVGGAIVIRAGSASQSIRVEGPRTSPVGAMSRLRLDVRPFVVRLAPKGGPAVGGNDAGAVLAVRTELALASAAWGQCGITFGKVDAIDIKIVDPPTSYLVSFGDDLGIAASGGTVRVKVDGKSISSVISRGSSPLGAARSFAAAVIKAGFSATLSPNVRIVPGAADSVDVLVRSGATLAHVEPASGVAAADDASMVVRIGNVDLSDGLFHFGDMDSMSGTLEERTLVKAFDDGDPSTVELYFVSSFTGGDRIGESFIQNDMSSVRNLVLIDRAGVRARRMSSTLAHEIGHVLMNAPGHPDDYGLDTPTLLMDSDGADASPFGPRRITIDECARAVRESGPKSRVPLLSAWPLTPLRSDPQRLTPPKHR